MSMTRAMAACPTPCAGGALGQTEPMTMKTPLGLATLGGPRGQLTLTARGETIDLGGAANFMSAAFVEREGNPFLVALHSDGTGCPARHALQEVRPGRVGPTETFGTCSDPVDVIWDDETVTATMPSTDATTDDVAFVYDGRTIRPEARPLDVSGRSPGGDPTAWIGAHPADLRAVPDRTAAFEAATGRDASAEARRSLGTGTDMEREGDRVAGFVSMPHAWGPNGAAIAPSAPDGRLLPAMALEGEPARLRGDPRGAPSPTVLDVPPGI